jgi:hypothetical protein
MTRYVSRFAKSSGKQALEQNKGNSIGLLTALAGVAIASTVLGGSLITINWIPLKPPVPCCEPIETISQEVYVAYQVNTPQAVKLASYFNYDLSRNLKPEHRLNVDLMHDEKVENLYSNSAEQGEVQHLNQDLHLTASGDEALIQAVQRVKSLVKQNGGKRPLDAFIVSEGTSNPATIRTIQQITQTIEPQARTRLYLIGLTPENKLATSAAFRPVQAIVMGSCTNNYGQCRGFAENLAN